MQAKGKVLVVVERFYPEDFLVNDLVAEWMRQGMEVEVLTQVPSYPFDRIYAGYTNKRFQTTVEDLGGGKGPKVIVHRVSTIFGYNRSVKRKILNYLHFGWRTMWWALWHGRRYERVFIYHTAALTMAMAAIPMRRIWRRPVAIWTQDLWPDAVWGYGFKPSRFKEWLLNSFVWIIYAQCNRIAVSCPGYVARIREICGREAEFIPQWDVDSCAASISRPVQESDRSKPLVFIFAGNLGVPQNLENDIEGFLQAGLENVELWLVGGGVMLEPLKDKYEAKAGGRIRFCGRQPRSQMRKWYAQADALIISLTDAYKLTLPGKFQSYLKTGKPLLGFISGATRLFIDGEPVPGVEVGESCGRLGWTAAPDEVDEIASAYRKMAESIRNGQGNVFGENCRRLSEKLFERGKQIERLRELMEFNAEKQRREEAERIQ
jgi:hypothetical protein